MKLYDIKNLGEAGVFQKAVQGVKNFAQGAVNQIKNANQPLQIGNPKPAQPAAQQQPAKPQVNGQQAAQQFVEIMKKNGANLKMEDIKMIRQQLNALLKQKQPTQPTQPQARTAPANPVPAQPKP